MEQTGAGEMKREEVIELARMAGINGEPAGPSDQGIDTWYGNQYLPSGALERFAELVIERAGKDTARLDHIEKDWFWNAGTGPHKTLREAIDADIAGHTRDDPGTPKLVTAP
jgi:hypothetical protein